MNRLCRCGGRIKRTDIVRVHVGGKIMYQDTDSLVANFECDSCHLTYTQRKRQPSAKVEICKACNGTGKVVKGV